MIAAVYGPEQQIDRRLNKKMTGADLFTGGTEEAKETDTEEVQELKASDGETETKDAKRASDKLGSEPINGLMIRMAAPLMVSMFVMALYNVVDSIFVGKYSTDSLTAVSFCMPFQNLNVAFAIGTAVGMSALLSRYLGAKEYAKADKVAHNGFILACINYIIFFTIGCFAEPIMLAMAGGKAGEQVIADGTVYLRITQWLSIAPMIQAMFERLLQSTGRTKYIFYIQVSGAVFNVIMDPILIFGLLGFPEMGVKGAAIATVFGQILGCILGFCLNRKYNREIRLSLSKIRPHLRTIREIYRIGIPSIVLQAVGAVMTFSLNMILAPLSDLAVTTFGVYFKLQMFVFMPIFGLNSASVPIVAYNYGADRIDRVRSTMSLGVKYAVVMMTAGACLFWIFPAQLMGLFSAPPELTAMGIVALHIMSFNFPFAGYSIMRGAAFQALGKSVYSMNISLVRQLVVIIPLAFVFARIGGVNMVWFAFPVAEIVGTTMSVLYTRHIRASIFSGMTQRDRFGNPIDESTGSY